jgi:uncharacterized membrane protein YesL
MSIFSYESKFSRVLMRVAESCMLNMMWLVCSLPIVTMGAATSALYAVTLKMPKQEEGDLVQQFIAAFKSCIKQATVLWLIVLAVGAVLGLDIYVLMHLRSSSAGGAAVMWTLVLAVVIAACVAFVMMLTFLFPLVGWVENTTLAMIRNAFFISARYLFATLLVIIIHFAMFVAIVRFFTPLIVFGEGACAVLSSYLIRPVFDLCTVPAGSTQQLEGEVDGETGDAE